MGKHTRRFLSGLLFVSLGTGVIAGFFAFAALLLAPAVLATEYSAHWLWAYLPVLLAVIYYSGDNK
jgi:hypothetical protein